MPHRQFRRAAGSKPPGAAPLAPFPGSNARPGPGDPWLAKLGLVGCQVKATLCTTLCIAWGERGAPLWISRRAGVN
jgi:hypothetical protein